jgi:hypothetical protein
VPSAPCGHKGAHDGSLRAALDHVHRGQDHSFARRLPRSSPPPRRRSQRARVTLSSYASTSLSRSPCVWHSYSPQLLHGDRSVARGISRFVIPLFALTMFMILPYPCFSMTFKASRTQLKTPVRLTAMIRFYPLSPTFGHVSASSQHMPPGPAVGRLPMRLIHHWR